MGRAARSETLFDPAEPPKLRRLDFVRVPEGRLRIREVLDREAQTLQGWGVHVDPGAAHLLPHDRHRGLLAAHQVAEVRYDLVRDGDEGGGLLLGALVSPKSRVRLPDEDERDGSQHFPEVPEPVVRETPDRVRPGHVVHEQGALAPDERALLDVLVALLTEDVPDHEGQVDGPVWVLHAKVFLRDLRADRRDVVIRELVHDEPADEGGLADRAVPEEEDLPLDVIVHHEASDHPRGPLITVFGPVSPVQLDPATRRRPWASPS